MGYVFAALLLVTLVAPCATGAAPQTGTPSATATNGTSVASAIVLTQDDDDAAIKAEDTWLEQHYPGYQKTGQALLNNNGHFYDAIEITTASKEAEKVYFDVTKPYNALTDILKPN